jgi:hypothetical protein
MRRSKFKIAEPRRFNGESEATVLIEHAGEQGMFTVRPKHSRTIYAKTLADVAAWVIDRCAKEEAERIRAERKKPRAMRSDVSM